LSSLGGASGWKLKFSTVCFAALRACQQNHWVAGAAVAHSHCHQHGPCRACGQAVAGARPHTPRRERNQQGQPPADLENTWHAPTACWLTPRSIGSIYRGSASGHNSPLQHHRACPTNGPDRGAARSILTRWTLLFRRIRFD